jgi:ABC-type long-subunit fatty acid transport system fused permease/ATPase subunit
MSDNEKPTTTHSIVALYIFIGIIYTFYSWIYGDTAHKSFLYNIGRGLLWPAVMFPIIGKIIGAIVVVIFVGLTLMS